MIDVAIDIKVPYCWTGVIFRRYSKVVRILNYKIDIKRNVITDLVQIYLDKDTNIDTLMEQIRLMDSVVDARIREFHKGTLVLEVTSRGCPLYSILKYDSLCFKSENIKADGCIEMLLSVRKRRYINYIIKKIKKEAWNIRIENIKLHPRKHPISLRQEAIIKTALDLGYYDCPKKITLRALADILGISPSTLNEALRKAEKKIISSYFSSKRPISFKIE
jgi:predicted DNA binding protein